MSEISKQELEQVAAESAKKAVTEILSKLGIDAENFRESQADQLYLRKQRLASEQIGKITARIVMTLFLTGVCSMFVLGIKEYLHK